MSHPSLKISRALLVVGLLGVALGACGRRGPLEPPPNATNAINLPDSAIGADEEDRAADAQTPVGVTPLGRPAKASRQVTVPEKPFVLDPIL